MEEQLKSLLDKYEPDDLFNADETALYYKLLFDINLVHKGKENAHGETCSKQWLTVLLVVNMKGTEKLLFY